MADRRAVSDAIGFVLVFGIIISTVAVVYVGGFNSLDNARQYERMNNAERAFEVFHDNVQDITHRGAPSRATEIKLAEASLSSGDRRSVDVNVSRHNDDSKSANRTSIGYQPIVYQSSTDRSNEVTYGMGATMRKSSGGAVMTEPPGWVISDDRVLIQLIRTVPEETGSVAGSETVLIRTEFTSSQVLFANTTHSSNVTITMRTERADAWEDYFRDQSASVSCTRPAAGEVKCEISDVDTVYVTVVRLDYTFE